MKLSIIIISYNESQFLEKAVESCLNQDYDDYEIIIGDDGSDDGSLDIIKRYAETNGVKYFVMERNARYYIPSIRVSNIIKRALTIATGQYICVLSGDDYFVDMKRFREHTEFLDAHSKYSAVFSKYEEYHEKIRNLTLLVHIVIAEICFAVECTRIYRVLPFVKKCMKTNDFWIKCVMIQV